MPDILPEILEAFTLRAIISRMEKVAVPNRDLDIWIWFATQTKEVEAFDRIGNIRGLASIRGDILQLV